VAEIFVERAESASTTDRTQLQKMLSYCRSHRGRIQFLVVYMLDRFARNQYDHHALKAYLLKLGITLRALAQPIDDSVTGKLMEGILAAFNEFDNNVRRERCTTGMKAAASRGRWIFPPPLGYRIALRADGGKTIEPDPEVGPLVRHGFPNGGCGPPRRSGDPPRAPLPRPDCAARRADQ
jgi:DNA invertase Pin-like site-specific DNA recombinase